MEILIFLVIGIVWTVIQALMKSQQAQPGSAPPNPRRAAPANPPQGAVPSYSFSPSERGDDLKDSQTHEIAPPMEVIETEQDLGIGFAVSRDDLAKGVIMAEVLGPPRARNPRSLSRRR